MQLSANQMGLGRLQEYANRFADWWLSELLDLLPGKASELLSGHEQQLLIVAADQGAITLELMTGRRAFIASERAMLDRGTPARIDQFLAGRGLERRDVDVGLRLPPESMFVRRLRLPAEARNDVEAVVARDLSSKTPFKPGDVYSDHAPPSSIGDGKVEVWQWVVRRQFVQQALVPLELGIEDIAFIVSDSGDGRHPMPFVNLRHATKTGVSWIGKITSILSCSALVLILIAGGLKYWNQQAALDRLEAEIATTGVNAQRIRALVDQLKDKRSALVRLRLQRSQAPGLIDLWEETTRILPKHSWLTEFRLAEEAGQGGQKVIMIGFSGAAPSLVSVIDGSPMFVDASLISPVTLDPTEGRERFTLQTRVKGSQSPKETAQ